MLTAIKAYFCAIMLKSKIFLGLFLIVGVLSSCKKQVSSEKQASIDDAIIVDFIAKKNIPAVKHPSGLYYQIITPGAGNTTINGSTKVTVNYEGKTLNGNIFDKSSAPATFPLGGLIQGWQIGIPLIQNGGKIRLIVPSGLAYGSSSPSASIPENAVLDFTIELINAQ